MTSWPIALPGYVLSFMKCEKSNSMSFKVASEFCLWKTSCLDLSQSVTLLYLHRVSLRLWSTAYVPISNAGPQLRTSPVYGPFLHCGRPTELESIPQARL
jgi:hypothetical protein